MSDRHLSDRTDESAQNGDVQPKTAPTQLATSYLPLWLLLAFAAVVACGVLTK
jgi:hypothetical protein